MDKQDSNDKTPTATCECDAGIVWLSEQDNLAELKAEQGTGQPVSFSFGFGGASRTWRVCDKCPGEREAAQP